jgi:hypothetical protein
MAFINRYAMARAASSTRAWLSDYSLDRSVAKLNEQSEPTTRSELAHQKQQVRAGYSAESLMLL